MNGDYREDLIRYRIERARETFEEALLMQREDHWNACANRLYYACFYAVTAILAKKGLASSKHTGVKALFNRHLSGWRNSPKIDSSFTKASEGPRAIYPRASARRILANASKGGKGAMNV